MRIHPAGLSALLLALAPAFVGAADAPAASVSVSREVEHVLSMSVDGTLLVDTDGSVRECTITTKLTPGLADALGKAIKAWRFEPVRIDGELVRAAAKMRVSLAATKDGDNYKVHVENAVFRPATPDAGKEPLAQTTAVEATGRRMNPPVYPMTLLRAGLSGRVLVALHFSADGKVLEVVPVQTMVFDARGQDHLLLTAMRQFEAATISAARRWRVSVKTIPGASTTAKDFTAYTTVDYVIGTPTNADPAGEWRLVARTAKRPPPWLSKVDAPDVGVADLGSGETYPLAEALRLASPVANTLL